MSSKSIAIAEEAIDLLHIPGPLFEVIRDSGLSINYSERAKVKYIVTFTGLMYLACLTYQRHEWPKTCLSHPHVTGTIWESIPRKEADIMASAAYSQDGIFTRFIYPPQRARGILRNFIRNRGTLDYQEELEFFQKHKTGE